jgi:DNA anti-recombination protein RmuC
MKIYFWVALVLVCISATFYVGYSAGSSEVKQQWVAEQKANTAKVNELKVNYEEQLNEYRQKTDSLSKEIYDTRTQYDDRIATIKSDYTNRLLNSEQRASVYKRMSEAGKCTSDDLSAYTAKLDRSLTEGRELVRELRELIKLRDQQLNQLGKELEGLVNVSK